MNLIEKCSAAAAARSINQYCPPRCFELAEKQFRLALEAKGEKIACLEARKHLCWYLRGVPYASYAKEEINKAQTAKDVERCLRLIRTEL